ncbi:MAG TPA: class I SAM-dependent methyltransferase [Dehalococcoidia bacterium]|nr:class I SAM-dependent methyltransferase [Dehalococcoidia bacterium]
MSIRPEERRTAAAYDRWLRGGSPGRVLMRALRAPLSTYLFNTPVLDLPHEVALRPGHRVLDLGCGAGGLAQTLAARAGLRHDPVGIDVSREMVRLAARELGRGRRVQLVAAGASRLPFADESFHLVLAAHLFRHLEDDTLYRVLLEAQRVLKPRGIVLGWEFAPTSSEKLNRLNGRLLLPHRAPLHLRGFAALAPYAVEVGFRHIDRLRFRLPFLFPPIPHVVVMFQKGRETPDPVGDEDAGGRGALRSAKLGADEVGQQPR